MGLRDNKIGDEGATALAAAVAVSGSLAVLSLQANNIGDEGAKALAPAVAASSSLANIRLGGCGIGDEAAPRCCQLLLPLASHDEQQRTPGHVARRRRSRLPAAR